MSWPPCVDCGRPQDPAKPFPAGRYEEQPIDGGDYRPVYIGPLCLECFLAPADRREATPSLMPEESGSVGTSSPSTESPGGVSRSGS